MSDPFANNTADVQNPTRLTHWRRRALEGRGFRESNPFMVTNLLQIQSGVFHGKKFGFYTPGGLGSERSMRFCDDPQNRL